MEDECLVNEVWMLSSCFPLQLQKQRTERQLGPTGVHARRSYFMSNYYQIITLKRRAQFHLGQTLHVLKSCSCSHKTFFYQRVFIKKKPKKLLMMCCNYKHTHRHIHAHSLGLQESEMHWLTIFSAKCRVSFLFNMLFCTFGYMFIYWVIVSTYSWHSKYPVHFFPCDSELQLPELWLAKGN